MTCSVLMYVAGYAAQRIVEPVAMDQRNLRQYLQHKSILMKQERGHIGKIHKENHIIGGDRRQSILLISEAYVMMHIALSVERALMSIEYLIAKDVHIAGQEYPGLHGIDKMRNA